MKKSILFSTFILIMSFGFAQDYEMWGVTRIGGDDDMGTIYKTDAVGENYEVVYSFSDGSGPVGSLLYASNGLLYGATTFGGDNDMGIIYSFDPKTEIFTKILDLAISTGSEPRASFMEASNGMLYLTTYQGGANNAGAIIELDPSDNSTSVAMSFGVSAGWPAQPLAGELIELSDGKLYGMTRFGGLHNAGTIYSFDPTNNGLATIHDFSAPSNGGQPFNSLLQASNGMLYGMTNSGGPTNYGGIFIYDVDADTFATQEMFSNIGAGGTNPQAALIEAADGKLYGMTSTSGYLFSFDMTTTDVTPLHSVGDARSTLLEASNGKLYGTTYTGSLFEYDIDTDTYTVKSEVGNYSLYGHLTEVSLQPSVSNIIVSGIEGSTFVEIDSDLQMEAEVTPSDAEQDVLWEVQNGTGQATIDANTGILTGVALGTVTVIATATDGSGIEGQLQITVVESLGIDHKQQSDISIYPNPVKDIVYIDVDGLTRASVYTLDGKLLKTTNDNVLHLESLQSGVYFVQVETTLGVENAKLIKE